MTEEAPHFRAYGDGGDIIGARRSRRAFRWCIVLCLFLTASLWFSERFLRYSHSERLYLSAITKPPEQARVFLRQAVHQDAKTSKSPTAKYLLALAGREESDQILATYERASQADPGNWAVAIRYGIELFRAGKPKEARDRFASAAEYAPKNALPSYLEAAVLPWVLDSQADQGTAEALRRSLALIARTNSSGKRVDYPRPSWSSDLPRNGYWYAHLSTDLVENCSDPFLSFLDFTEGQAMNEANSDWAPYWDSWLGHLETMGERIASGAIPEDPLAPVELFSGAAEQVYTGLRIQLVAVRQRELFAENQPGAAPETQTARREALEAALDTLTRFQDKRRAQTAMEREGYAFPLFLLAKTIAVLAVFYAGVTVLAKSIRAGKYNATIPHTRSGYGVLVAIPSALFVLLSAASVIQATRPSPDTNWMPVLQALWWGLVTFFIAYGFIYPLLVLPTAQEVCEQAGCPPALLRQAMKRKRQAWACLLRRYCGIGISLIVCALCLWVVTHRIVRGLYPWQIELLASGFSAQESEIVGTVLEGLRVSSPR